MKTQTDFPQTLKDAIEYFKDPDNCLNFMVKIRWQGNVICPRCGSPYVSFLQTRRLWKCLKCKKQFSAKVGTIFEDSPLGLDKWLAALWIVVNAKNGVSSYEIARSLGVSQKTAWFMDHRIRMLMQTKTFEKLSGQVEADETFIGGLAKNMHKDRRERVITGTGGKDKTAVLGLIQRNGEVRTQVISDTKKKTIQPIVRENVEKGSQIFTDTNPSYNGLAQDYTHETVDHAKQYVKDGYIHTNKLENFWSLWKRSITGPPCANIG